MKACNRACLKRGNTKDGRTYPRVSFSAGCLARTYNNDRSLLSPPHKAGHNGCALFEEFYVT
jgi:hypothetical protein